MPAHTPSPAPTLAPRTARPVLVAALLAALPAAAQVRPEITVEGAKIRAYPLAVAPALGDVEAARPVLEVLAADLGRTGLFQLLDPSSFLADPGEPLDAEGVKFAKWQAVGAAALIKSSFKPTAKELKAELRLYDVARGTELLRGSYAAPPGAARTIAHRFADDLALHFTGQPGAFQTRIAYVRETEQGKQIAVADADGANAAQLTSASINLLPSWAPDGRSIAFTTFRDGAPHIYSVDVATRRIQPLVRMGDFATGAAFAPDGLRFTFAAALDDNTDVYLSQADGSAGRRLTDSRGIDLSATWSPDGKQLCFVSDRAGAPQLYVMNADGSGQKRVTFKGNYNQEPAWSPRGDLIAFSGRDEKRVFDIYTLDVKSGEIKRLTQGQGTNERPAWAPNGRSILFSSTRSGKRQLWVMAPDGTNPQRITDEPRGASDPAWGPLPSK